jgi:ethanolaminephosphotransferase
MTQSRIANIPLFLLLHLQHRFLLLASVSTLSPAELATTSLVMQHAAFFAFGGTNSIASVDLANAYNGVAGFNLPLVGVLGFVANWAGPIWWVFAINVFLRERVGYQPSGNNNNVLLAHGALITLFFASATAAVMAACAALRTHLFIWTVFSPKYLYCTAWTAVHHVDVNLVLGAVLFWLG